MGCIISIIITLFGLIGLTYFGTYRRLKEFSIRKIFGASGNSILNMLLKQTFRWTLLASAISIPVATYIINEWLNSFAYRIDTPLSLYLIVILFATVITTLSVLYQTLIASTMNPAEVLRHD
jgi:putative ABC transport system permease protein